MISTHDKIIAAFQKNKGILRLVPNWIPREFNIPGKRLRLHPDDYFCFGLSRGSIKERWFSSTVTAMNGPLAPPEEGLSKVALSNAYSDTVFFRDVVDLLGEQLIGPELQNCYGGWPMYCKYFDNAGPLEHHLHLDDRHAAEIGLLGKPEAYYFPAQLNNYSGSFPVTYFGYSPDVTRDEVRRRLMMFESGDNRITELSRAYRLQPGTGWYTPPGVAHAPGSLLTYEPQWNSDVGSIQENIINGKECPRIKLVANLPENKQNDMDAIMDLMDWDANIDPDYRRKYFRPPVPVNTNSSEWSESWITYDNPYFAAKETTVHPGCTAILKDVAAYGCIIIQGHGVFGSFADAEAATLLRFNQLSGDEYFVSEDAARDGVRVVNRSSYEPMVILRHFGPNAGAPNTTTTVSAS